MVIGDRRTEKLCFGDCEGRLFSGRVVWIHPERRFYVVEFEFDGGSFREAFPCRGMGGRQPWAEDRRS